jgi:hypothetical protein
VAAFACGDDAQALVWLLRRDTIATSGMLREDAAPIAATVRVPGLLEGDYTVVAYDTRAGTEMARYPGRARGDGLTLLTPPFAGDIALAIRRG